MNDVKKSAIWFNGVLTTVMLGLGVLFLNGMWTHNGDILIFVTFAGVLFGAAWVTTAVEGIK